MDTRTDVPTAARSMPSPRAGSPPALGDPLAELAAFPLVDALLGRRSRRFALGDEIPDGPLAYRPRHEPVPLTDLERTLVLSAMEQYALTEATAELATSCYAGVLMLQAMGLGGWMFDGIDRSTMLGASGDPDVPGLGFRYDIDDRWALPNPTGLPGVFEAFCPPHHLDMAGAVEAFTQRKFGPGGPFDSGTPGAWTDSPGFRGAAQVHDEEFKALVTCQAQYVLDTFGKFPGTVPTLFVLNYVQAHHLDLDFYDRFFRPGAYLGTHAEHMRLWHSEEGD